MTGGMGPAHQGPPGRSWYVMGTSRRAAATLVALMVALGVGLSIPSGPVGAQQDPPGRPTTTAPYGSSSTTSTPPGQTPSCLLRTEAGAVGTRASVTVRSVARGSTIRLLFDGRQVAEAEATGPGRSKRTNVDIDFTVPESRPGMHRVTAVGADFTAACQTSRGEDFEVVADGAVLGAQVTQDQSGGSLPRTGIYLAILLAAAAVGLLLLGRALLTGSKRRAAASTASRTRTGV